VIKLPQEYWIHIARIDTTDWIKVSLFDVNTSVSWGEIFRAQPVVLLALLALLMVVLLAAWWFVRRRLPPSDRALTFSADAHQPTFTEEQVRSALVSEARHIVDAALAEKILLITLVSVCFAQVLPAVQTSDLQLIIGVGLLVAVNTALSHWLARRGFAWAFSQRASIMMGVANVALVLAYAFLRSMIDAPVRIENALFMALLLTLLVTLFDRYRQVYLIRHGPIPA